MFISHPHNGVIYIAERRRKNQGRANGLRWSSMPVVMITADSRIEARCVPAKIRRAAYKLFERDRIRADKS